MADRKILMGARDIAEFALGDPDQARAIYRLQKSAAMPIFKLGGTIAARPEKLDEWLANLEAAASNEAAESEKTVAA